MTIKAIIIKGHNQQEYEDKWQGWQNWTDEKLATNLTKDDQQLALLLPAKRWLDTLPEFESEGCWQRPQTWVKCRHCPTSRCGFIKNPSLRSNKCHGCEKQIQTKGRSKCRPKDGIVFTNADSWYARKLGDPHGGDTIMIMLMQQVIEVMKVNQ